MSESRLNSRRLTGRRDAQYLQRHGGGVEQGFLFTDWFGLKVDLSNVEVVAHCELMSVT